MIPTRSRSLADPDPAAGIRFVTLAHDLHARDEGLAGAADDPEGLVVLGPGQAVLSPDFNIQVLAAAAERPDVALFYGDDAVVGEPSPRLHLKPAFNRALLHAQDYIGPLVVIRAGALRRLGGLQPQMATAALYDLVLRADGEGLPIEAIRSVLAVYRGERPACSPADRRTALMQACAQDGGPTMLLPGLTPQSLRLRRRFVVHPEVTLLIPTRQAAAEGGEAHIARLLDSLAASSWPSDRLRVLIGDDVEPGEIYGDLRRYPFLVERLITGRPPQAPFNYAAKMNRLWRAARTEHLVMLNDDVRVVAPDWLEGLMSFAVDREVGGVGARLLYPDGSVQHAGMVGGPFGVFIHPWIGQPGDQPTYGDWALVQRDWSAVTGAVFATRRSALEAVNGFDERFALEYNDVDLCLRLKLAGYRIVQAPDALLIHHEKASRGETAAPGSQTALFLRRWGQVIANDPAYHPGLRRDGFVVQPAPTGGAWYTQISVG
ncbi:glycosyltransferase [Caulobacter sp. S45]|uniref:glycosyltransferase family 2 protein n=1 Tax=Caulobacter sp. S45 TaxID=1641861 RepID=UPI0015759254|nr:glycosyltransferase [Caulobacter sp. S45]